MLFVLIVFVPFLDSKNQIFIKYINNLIMVFNFLVHSCCCKRGIETFFFLFILTNMIKIGKSRLIR